MLLFRSKDISTRIFYLILDGKINKMGSILVSLVRKFYNRKCQVYMFTLTADLTGIPLGNSILLKNTFIVTILKYI